MRGLRSIERRQEDFAFMAEDEKFGLCGKPNHVDPAARQARGLWSQIRLRIRAMGRIFGKRLLLFPVCGKLGLVSGV